MTTSSRPGPLRHGLQTVMARAYPRVVGANREPSWVFFEVALPLLATVALVMVYRALDAPPRFEGYVILGGAMTAFWLNTIWNMAAQFRWEKENGNLELYLASPAHLMWILTGMALGGSFSTSLKAAAVITVGAEVFDVPFIWSAWPVALLILLVTLSALYGVGMALSSLFLKFGRNAEQGISSLMEPVFLVSGAYFPVSALGVGAAVAGSLVAMTLGMDALRQVLLAGDAFELLAWPIEGGLLAVYAVVVMMIARWALRRMEYAAKVAGRLTLRWQ